MKINYDTFAVLWLNLKQSLDFTLIDAVKPLVHLETIHDDAEC